MRFDEVVCLDDFFRSSDAGMDSYPVNRRTLFGLFSASCRRLGLPIRECFAASDGGGVPVGALLDRLGLERSAHGWAAASAAQLGDAPADVAELRFGRRTLVIGWGLPLSILRHIDSTGAAFLDIEVDPRRFARHLNFCVRTNDPQIERILRNLEVPQELFWDAAATLRGAFARKGESFLIGPQFSVALFAGQTEVDLALVEQGRLVSPAHCIERISALAEEVDILLVKRHPYAGSANLLEKVIPEIPNAMVTDLNVYALLTARNLSFVSSISSGVLKEADYFGVPARALIRPDRNDPLQLPRACSRWYAVTANVASLDFFSRMCRSGPRLLRLFAPRNSAETFSADALDEIFGSRWGFERGAKGLPECVLIEANQTYQFVRGKEPVQWLGGGWNAPEPWGVWSSEANCRLVLPLGPSANSLAGTARLEFYGSFFAHEGGSARLLAVELNGSPHDFAVSNDGEARVISLEIAAEQLRGKSLMEVRFAVTGMARPAEGVDVRQLGLGLRGIRLRVE